jgi:hypothetical protein
LGCRRGGLLLLEQAPDVYRRAFEKEYRRADDAERSFQEADKREVEAGDESEGTGRGRRRGRLAIGRQMSYDVHGDRKTAGERRREQVRHLVRSVGVELEDGVSVPFFVEPVPGRFRRNPSLKAVDVKDEQLRTLEVPAEVPAKIPSSGLPLETLKHLIEIGLRNGDDL